MADCLKLWRRVCAACGQLDRRFAIIASTTEWSRRLDAESWSCPSCGATDYRAGHRMTDDDWDEMIEAYDAAIQDTPLQDMPVQDTSLSNASRPRLYDRCCRACHRLDEARPLIAGSHADGEAALRAEPWLCPSCGAADYDVSTPYQEGDLDNARPMVTRRPTLEPGESLTRLEPHCRAEIAPDRACWKPIPRGSRAPLCPEHAAERGVVISARQARMAQAEREWQQERWRGEADDVPRE